MTHRKKRQGFTLIELLITVILIAVLAGMLLLSTGSAVSMAEASKIVNDLRSLQAAVLFYYLENDGFPSVGASGSATPLSAAEVKSISAYMDRELPASRYGAIYLTQGPASDGRVLLGVKYDGATSSAGLPPLNQRLANMASASGLRNAVGDVFVPAATTDVVYIWLK